jgi:hypothetical protein
MQVVAANGSSKKRTLEIDFRGAWFEERDRMLGQAVDIKFIR